MGSTLASSKKKDINKIVGANIKKLQKERGLKQNELCIQLNYSPFTLSRIEKGIRTVPLEELQGIADFFGVSISYLCGESEQRNIDIKSDGEDFMYQVITLGLDKLDVNAQKKVIDKLLWGFQ